MTVRCYVCGGTNIRVEAKTGAQPMSWDQGFMLGFAFGLAVCAIAYLGHM